MNFLGQILSVYSPVIIILVFLVGYVASTLYGAVVKRFNDEPISNTPSMRSSDHSDRMAGLGLRVLTPEQEELCIRCYGASWPRIKELLAAIEHSAQRIKEISDGPSVYPTNQNK